MDFTYHGAFNENSILCELTPFVLGHLNSKNTLWNETVMRSFIVALAHHMDMFRNSPEYTLWRENVGVYFAGSPRLGHTRTVVRY